MARPRRRGALGHGRGGSVAAPASEPAAHVGRDHRARRWAAQEYGWGGDKLVSVLAAEGIVIAPRTVDRIIQREGLTRPDTAPAPALTRFERSAPNELWQMDAKGWYRSGPPASVIR